MHTQIQQRANANPAAMSEMALRVAAIAKMRSAVTTCWPHLHQLRPGEQRLVRIVDWSVKADATVTPEQNEWLEDIVNRVTAKKAA